MARVTVTLDGWYMATWLTRGTDPEVARDDGQVFTVARDVHLVGIRHLRAGQRVRVRMLDSVVVEVRWPTDLGEVP